MSRLHKAILFLLEPASTVHEAAARRRARLLAAILLLLIPSVLAASYWQWLSPQTVPMLYACFVFLLAAFVLNRRGQTSLAGVMTLVLVMIGPYIGLGLQGTQLVIGVNIALAFSVVSVMIAYLLFPPMVVVATFAANLAGILLIPMILPTLAQEALFALFFFLICSALILIAAGLRRYDQGQIEQQAMALAESEARYRRLLEATFEAIIIHDGGTLLDANPVFEHMLGGKLSDIVGQPLSRFVAPEDRKILSPGFDVGPADPYEATLIRADGSTLRVEVLAKGLTYHGRGMRVVAMRDVTDRRQAEAERLELSIEREKSKVLLRFMSNLSHDLRTPLTVIKTSLYLLKRLRDDPVQREHHMNVLQTQTDHLKKLLDDILNMSRLDRADADEFNFAPTDINALLAWCVEEHRPLAERKDQTLTFHPCSSLPDVRADERQLKLMVKHLLVNAVNYTPEQGTITVESDVDAAQVLIRVCDTGIGIEADDLPYVYDYFFRAESARNSERGGTGLGLSIAKKIVETHGGTIDAESTPGQETTFTIRLPVAQAVLNHAPADEQPTQAVENRET